MKIKVIQTYMKMQSLVISITPSLKEIGLKGIQTDIEMYSSVVPIAIPSLKEIGL